MQVARPVKATGLQGFSTGNSDWKKRYFGDAVASHGSQNMPSPPSADQRPSTEKFLVRLSSALVAIHQHLPLCIFSKEECRQEGYRLFLESG